MIDSVKFLEENGYLFLPDFIDKNSCRLMAESMIQSVESGKGTMDPQCPRSPAFYGAFDTAQNEILPHLEEVCGKKLLSTYNYSRLYKPGEILEEHTDRESCEYSITLTLGFDGEPWPFFIKDVNGREIKIILSAGDAILYKGIERPHWREKYVEGNWQAQSFFHYVDSKSSNRYYSVLEKMKVDSDVFIEEI